MEHKALCNCGLGRKYQQLLVCFQEEDNSGHLSDAHGNVSQCVSKEKAACDNAEYVYLTLRESSNSGKGHCNESGGQLDDI